jgi:alpha-ribazole phosphatase/probable phosphoglycerate mutase
MRHGRTASNEQKIYAGWCDEELTGAGIEGVKKKIELGIRGKGLGGKIKKIYTSPIRRTVQTAEIVDEYLDVGIEIVEEFKEIKMGPWEGLAEKEVIKKFPDEWNLWNTRPSRLNMEGRETLIELQQRALKGIEKIKCNGDYSEVLVITHVAIIRVLMIYYNDLSLDIYRKLEVPNCGLFLLDLNKGRVKAENSKW